MHKVSYSSFFCTNLNSLLKGRKLDRWLKKQGWQRQFASSIANSRGHVPSAFSGHFFRPFLKHAVSLTTIKGMDT